MYRHFREPSIFLQNWLVMIKIFAGSNNCLSHTFSHEKKCKEKKTQNLDTCLSNRHFDLITSFPWKTVYLYGLCTLSYKILCWKYLWFCFLFCLFPFKWLTEKIIGWLLAILNYHFYLISAIFVTDSIVSRTQHTLIMLKNHTLPNNTYLPLKHSSRSFL